MVGRHSGGELIPIGTQNFTWPIFVSKLKPSLDLAAQIDKSSTPNPVGC